jgi:zinc transport system substrate-binding protein
MADLSKAAIWLTIDSEFEMALKPKVAALYKDLSVVDTTLGIEYRTMESHQHEGEAAAEHTDVEEEGKDPHVWLGRQAVKAMAANIRDALSAFDPAGATLYSKNHDVFIDDVDTVFDSLKTILAPLEGKPVFVYHPAFGYFLDEFGIEQEAVETGGKEPTQKTLTVLIEEARADDAKVIFVQAQFPTSAAQTVATAIGGVVVSIDPLAPDWMENIKRIGAALTKAIR